MTDEKVLAFLNFEKKQRIDKTLMKIVFWFDFSFTCVVLFIGLLLDVFTFSFINIMGIFGCAFISGIFAVWCKKATNPTNEISFSILVMLTTTVKLLYGFLSFSNIEAVEDGYPRFSLFHLIVLFVTMVIVLYMWLRFYQIFRDLKIQTIEQTRKNVEKKQWRFWWMPISIGSPMIIVRLIKGSFANMGLGVGFWLWTLSCIWLCLTLILFPKYLIIKKYKVADIFTKKTGDG